MSLKPTGGYHAKHRKHIRNPYGEQLVENAQGFDHFQYLFVYHDYGWRISLPASVYHVDSRFLYFRTCHILVWLWTDTQRVFNKCLFNLVQVSAGYFPGLRRINICHINRSGIRIVYYYHDRLRPQPKRFPV